MSLEVNSAESSSKKDIIQKIGNKIIYRHNHTFYDFYFFTFPEQRDQYCILLISEPNPELKNLLTYIKNSFTDANIINEANLTPFKLGKKFTSTDTAKEELKKNLAIIDLTLDGKFVSLNSDIIRFKQEGSRLPDWLCNQYAFNIVNPNMMQNVDRNISHTVWLCDKLENVPTCLLSNSHMTFLVGGENIKEYVNKRIGITQNAYDNNFIFAVSSVLKKDLRIMKIARERFLDSGHIDTF